MASDKLLLISADGHAALSPPDYRPYVESRYQEAFDATVSRHDKGLEPKFFETVNKDFADRYQAIYYDTGAIEGRTDVHRRVEELNKDGVAGEVLFPDGAPFAALAFGKRAHYAPELEHAGARAYNRFIVDYVSSYPKRFAGQAILSLHDIEQTVKDIHWAAEHGLKGLVMPGMDDGLPLFWDERYEPLWSAAEETDLPLNFHGGIGSPQTEYPNIPLAVQLRVGVYEFPFWAHRPLWFLIWSGVLERHPQLRLIFTESHTDWIVPALAQMDHSWDHSMLIDSIRDIVKHKPSAYYERQVMMGSSLISRGEVAHRDKIGIHKMMFGVDFPHPEGTFGMTRDYLQATVGKTDITEPEVRLFLGLNAAQTFKFDVEALQPVVEEHGLTLEEVTTPIPPEKEGVFWKGLDVFRPSVA